MSDDIWRFEHLDISKWQGVVNFGAIKHHDVLSPYVLMRVTVGAGYKDEKFHEYYAQAQVHDVFKGGYFVIHPLFSPQAHLANFIDHLGDRTLKEICSDIELTGGAPDDVVRQRVRDTVLLFEQHYGDLVSIYSAQWFWDRYFKGESWHKRFRCHFAHYPFDPVPPRRLPVDYKSARLPAGWDWNTNPPHIHQYTSKRRYPEITAAYLDQNAANQAMFDRIFDSHEPPPDEEDEDNLVYVKFSPPIELLGELGGKVYTTSKTNEGEPLVVPNLPDDAKKVLVRLVASGPLGCWASIGYSKAPAESSILAAYPSALPDSDSATLPIEDAKIYFMREVGEYKQIRVWIRVYGYYK